MYSSTKIIKGFSTCFRQEKANPIHCYKLHGYSISFEVEFESEFLDDKNWVLDFGFLKRSDFRISLDGKNRTIGEWFDYMFDHTVVVAEDDTQLEWFKQGHEAGVLQLRIVKHVGCERFAQMVFEMLENYLRIERKNNSIQVKKVICRENENNSASYYKNSTFNNIFK